MDKIREALNGKDEVEEEEDEPLLSFPPGSDATDCGNWGWINGQNTSLSWSNRIKGFAACFMLGVFLNFAGVALLWSLNLVAFAVVYSLGNAACLLSTCFLCGPRAQLRQMFHRTRVVATLLVLLFLGLTLVSALVIGSNPLALVCVVVQSLALTWYSLSYVPLAREAARNFLDCCRRRLR